MKTDVESAKQKKKRKLTKIKKSCSTSQFSTNHKKIAENSTSEKNERRKIIIKKNEQKLFKCYFLQLNLLQQVYSIPKIHWTHKMLNEFVKEIYTIY